MDSSKLANDDLSKLNEKDKLELRQFLANESQRSQIQSSTHSLTEMCWNKCITGTVKNGALDGSETGCLTNCVERFLDFNFLTMKHIENLRQ